MTGSTALRVERPGQVYDRLRTLIIRGRIAPGTRVVENDIAERLGVSRTPARAAILKLYQEGFLIATDTTRRVELVVAPLTRDDLVDLYRIMGALEGSAARHLELLTEPRRRELVRDLRDLEARFESAALERKIDYDQMFERHNRFHERLMHACAAPRHRVMLDTVRPQVERYEWVYAPLIGPDHSATFAEHEDIIKAVRDGSAKKIRRAVAANWDMGAARLAVVIGDAGSRGDWVAAD